MAMAGRKELSFDGQKEWIDGIFKLCANRSHICMKIASISCLLLALALGTGSDPARGAGTNNMPRVGALREFDRFTFEGNTHFSGRSLWLALNSTFDFPELSHPLAPRDAFLATIEGQLRLGYVHCGFPAARITARYDSKKDRVVVQINEGPRYRCGPVEVIGARKMPTQAMVEALSVTNTDSDVVLQPFQFLDQAPVNRNEATETNNSCIWVGGQPAHFDDFSLRFLSGRVTNTLAKHGFFLSRFSLNIVTNAAGRAATLQVKILDEGPPATIGSIEMVGNRRNSREVLLNFLGLKPGMEFTSDMAADINDRLYHSARFLTNSVVAGTPDPSGRLKLTLQVLEQDDCPPLNGEFNPMEKTMLKARDWLAKLGGSRDEAVLSASRYSDEATTLQCILAPQQGLLFLENEAVSGTNRLRHALILSSSQIALYVPALQQDFETHFSTEQFKSFVTIETGPPGENGHTANFTVGAGIGSLEDEPGAPPYTLSMSLAPAAFVRLAHTTNSTIWFAGDQLIRSNADSVLELDVQTGRFIGFAFNGEEPRRSQGRLNFQPGAFESARAAIQRDCAGFTNVCRTNTPLGSAIAFFGSEVVQLKPVDTFLRSQLPALTCAQLPALLRQLGSADFLSPFETFKDTLKTTNDPAGEFKIPEASRPGGGGPVVDAMTTVAQWVLEGGDLIFPPRSWPWTVSRDIAFLFRGQPNYLQPDMHDIYDSRKTGPIGCLAAAQLLKSQNPSAAKAMAARGLERLSTDAFQSDYWLLLDEHYVAGRLTARLAATLGNLNEPELAAVVEPMSAAQAEFIRNCAQRVHAAKAGQPLVETLAPALDEYWESELKKNVANQLKKLANE